MYYLSKTDKERLLEIEDKDKILAEIEWLLDDAYEHGLESGVDEIAYSDMPDEWINEGSYDEAVQSRAEALGMIYKTKEVAQASQIMQEQHRLRCPNGVYGWEFCANCNK